VEELSDKIVAFLQKSIVPLMGVVIIAVAGGGVYSYMQMQKNKKLELTQNELFVIKKDIEKVSEKVNPSEAAPEMGADGKPLPAKTKKPVVQVSDEEKQKAYAEAFQKLNSFIKANQGSQSAVEGALIVAEVTSGYKKYDEGVAALRNALTGFDKSNFLFGVAQTELGNLLVQTDKCAEAAQAWEEVISQSAHAYLSNDLRLKTGICYEKTNQYDRAESLYQTIVEKSPESSAARTAKKFLLHIKYVKTKSGSQAEPKKG